MIIRLHITLLFVLAVPTRQAIAQARLNGYVTQQNSGKKPVPGVQVKSLFANPIATGNDGRFVLAFQNQQPGATVNVQVEKAGWEVVNNKELSTALLQNPDAKPLKVIMCTAGQLDKTRMAYYQIGEKYIRDEYDQRMKSLDRQKVGWQQKAAQYEQELSSLQKQLQEVADEYSRVNLDDLTATERKAIQFFKEGKINESIKLRESLNSEKEIKKSLSRKVVEDSIIAANTRNMLNLAKEYQLKFDFTNAEATLEKLALTDTTNAFNLYEFAYFYYRQNAYDKAIRWYQTCLKYTKNEGITAQILINMGNTYYLQHNYTLAEQIHKRALAIYESLALSQPQAYEDGLARVLTSLGLLYKAKNNYTLAEQTYKRAIVIRDRLVKENPQVYESDLAITLNNAGLLYYVKNDYVLAEFLCKRALSIYERLNLSAPKTYQKELAFTFNNLGLIYFADNNNLAEQTYKQALAIREKLAQENPQAHDPDLALTLSNLGNFYMYKKAYVLAEEFEKRALSIQKLLAQNDPKTYEFELAGMFTNLGNLYYTTKAYTLSEENYNQALSIYERLARSDPQTYNPALSVILTNLGAMYSNVSAYTLAEKSYKRAVIIREQLIQSSPDAFEPALANTLFNLGILYSVNKNYDSAQQVFKQALPIYERLAKLKPQIFEPYIANTLIYLGQLYQSKNEYNISRQFYTRALSVNRNLVTYNPGVYEILWCKNVLSIGYLQRYDFQPSEQDVINSQIVEAKKMLVKYSTMPSAVELLKALTELQTYFEDAKYLLGVQYLQKQVTQKVNFKDKINIQRQVIERYQVLINKGYSELGKELSSSLGGLAWYQLFNRQFPEAEQSVRQALTPNNFTKPDGYDAAVEWVNTNLALALLYQGKLEQAKAIYLKLKDKPYNKATYKETFLADLDELEKAGITHPDVAAIRKLLRE